MMLKIACNEESYELLIGKRKRNIEKERGYIMNLANQLYITLSKGNDRKYIRSSSSAIERDNRLMIYRDIEKIDVVKQQGSIDLDMQLLLRSLI